MALNSSIPFHLSREATGTLCIHGNRVFSWGRAAVLSLSLLRLLPINRLELKDVADGQELRRVATAGGPLLIEGMNLII